MRNLLKPAAVAAIGLSLFAIPVQAAVISANSAVVYELPGSGSTTVYGPTGPGVSAAGYTNVNGSAAQGYGQAAYGALHASATAIAAGSAGGTTQMRGQGGAYWLDQVTISGPTLTGQAFARGSFSLSGVLSSVSDLPPGGAMGNSTAVARVQVNGTNVFRANGQFVSQNGSTTINNLAVEGELNGAFYELDPGLSLNGLYTFDIPFTFGTSFQLFTTLDTFTQAVASFEGDLASAYSNFGSSAYWGGISNVHLADGTILTGYSIGSDSGFNWGNAFLTETPPPPPNGDPTAVPEPMTLGLLGAGLGGMAWLRRRRA